ncbi:hypothetical protein AB1N83_012541, partial [Pleurotus pulmonarius]
YTAGRRPKEKHSTAKREVENGEKEFKMARGRPQGVGNETEAAERENERAEQDRRKGHKEGKCKGRNEVGRSWNPNLRENGGERAGNATMALENADQGER